MHWPECDVAGQGACAGRYCYLPLTDGRIARLSVDITTATTIQNATTIQTTDAVQTLDAVGPIDAEGMGLDAFVGHPQRGTRFGQLLISGRQLVSLGRDRLSLFDDRQLLSSELDTKGVTPTLSAERLLRQADQRTAAGDFAGAIAASGSAYTALPSARTRNHLVAALLDGVRQSRLETAESFRLREQWNDELDRLASLHAESHEQ